MNEFYYLHILEKKDIWHNEYVDVFFELYDKYIRDFETFFKKSKEELLLRKVYNNKIFKKFITRIIIPDFTWEKTLTTFRKEICLNILDGHVYSDKFTSLVQSLAIQCFLNEYVYETTEVEINAIKQIVKNLDLEKNTASLHIAIIACYFPLHLLLDEIPSLEFFEPKTEEEKELILVLLKEPLQELEISKNIKTIGKISDSVSKKVRNQYYNNPYPRWRYCHFTSEENKINLKKDIENSLCTHCITESIIQKNKIKVLIAGCGTGQQVINASFYKDAEITAVDFSETSIAYAKRKCIEYGMTNVDFVLSDILSLNLFEEKFDVIECGGVLHHMDNPSQGLSILCSLLNNGGYLKIGLYSKHARKLITECREKIKSLNIDSTPDSIRKFRQKVFSGEYGNLKEITNMFLDFYTLSSCRDLCFHECEHQYTLEDISELLKNHNLEFCGFNIPNFIKDEYLKKFPSDVTMTNLDNWQIFEIDNPETFISMYQFICRNKN